jgi:uncharacterized protein YbjT (DUF2867 family)
MTQNVFVVGASGTIGQALLPLLVKAGHKVRALSHTPGKVFTAGVTGVNGDLRKPETIEPFLEGVKSAFLVLPAAPDLPLLAENFVKIAKKAGVEYIVRSSGAGADPQAPITFPRIQGQADQVVSQSGLAYSLLRPGNFMQNYLSFYGGMIKSGQISLPLGGSASAYVDARDIAAMAATILSQREKHEGKAYTLTGPRAFTQQEAAQILSQQLERPIRYVDVPAQIVGSAMQAAGASPWLVGAMLELYEVMKAGYTAAISPDIAQILGRDPVAFEQFVKDYAPSWQSHS